MEHDPQEIPFLSSIGLMLTYKCTVACPHCIVEAGPHRTEEMPLVHAMDWLDHARRYRQGVIEAVALTGGEPFYNLDHLAQVSAFSRSIGFIVTVVTNAFWATSRDAALRILEQLPAIQAIAVSADVYHQVAIPFERVKNAVCAARELGRIYTIAVCTDSEEDSEHQKIIKQLDAMGEADHVRVAVTLPVGRAQQARGLHYSISPDPAVAACPVASAPVIFPNGNVVACIGPLLTLPPGHPLFLGNLFHEPLAQILDRAEINPVLHAIRVWGPHKLVALLRHNGDAALLPKEYISNAACDACFKLLSNPSIVEALEHIFQDQELQQLVAQGRVHYLNETVTFDRLAQHTPTE